MGLFRKKKKVGVLCLFVFCARTKARITTPILISPNIANFSRDFSCALQAVEEPVKPVSDPALLSLEQVFEHAPRIPLRFSAFSAFFA
jgi:hypothetical protein